ncbi:hypothetical protein SARC_05941 [Sphaeroforma arctica JP610]|uniref:Histone-lysine N-methyltransferase n=1 Tax=Sphaeroforma arctica JP610 TaxID=667725 RepID=A0A0L0FY56_9EUKA|nr:hypothetical protein SARC_05941 [Sphaeroforma arctica JP610]KNC81757.1 hypothetical protein SARC_05941 [Sphaeroforma arctica JP610]|eukprot:XP_014155659.1 hypothetical protein SARC_05941 [Sphaeroforma arctica JP610]
MQANPEAHRHLDMYADIYADVLKPSLKERQAIVDDAICSCTVPSVPADGAGLTAELTGCGEDCVNRSTFTECSPMTCPVASICTNNRFQTNMVPCKLDVFDTNSKGYGVRCKSDIKRGALIAEYVGEIVSETECRRRMTERYKHMNNFYFLHHTGNNVIDGCQYGSAARFINHSCSPNAHIEKWTVKGLVRVGIFASTAIARGTEICYDYKYRVMGQGNVVCRCGSDNCSGFLGERPKKIVSMATGSHKKGRRKGNAAKSAKLAIAGEEPVLEVSLAQQRRNQARDFTYARKNRLFLVRNIPSHKLVPLDDLQPGRFGTANPDSRTNGLILGTTRNSAQNSTGRNSAMGRHGDVGRHSGTISSDSGVHLAVNTDYKQLVRIMRMIYTTVLKTVRGQCRLFLRLPPRSRYPDYYQLIDTPICLADIEQKINSGLYPTVEELQVRPISRTAQSQKRVHTATLHVTYLLYPTRWYCVHHVVV